MGYVATMMQIKHCIPFSPTYFSASPFQLAKTCWPWNPTKGSLLCQMSHITSSSMFINWQKLWKTQHAIMIFPPLSTLQSKFFKMHHQLFKLPKTFTMNTWPQFIELSNRTLLRPHLSLNFFIKYVCNG